MGEEDPAYIKKKRYEATRRDAPVAGPPRPAGAERLLVYASGAFTVALVVDDARLRAADGALDDGALDALRRAASGTPGDDPYVSVFFFSDFGGLDLGRMPA